MGSKQRQLAPRGPKPAASPSHPWVVRREHPNRVMDAVRYEDGPLTVIGMTESVRHWLNSFYYGVIRRFASGSPLGGGPYAVLSITSCDETARHDWRDFQQLKNLICGDEWTAVEQYPAESNLRDPSNRFYLFAFPPGVITWGLPPGRMVLDVGEGTATQRPFPAGHRPARGTGSPDGV